MQQNNKNFLYNTNVRVNTYINAPFVCNNTNESKLCFLVVKDMLLTGFDAPELNTLYVDGKSGEEHYDTDDPTVAEIKQFIYDNCIDGMVIPK